MDESTLDNILVAQKNYIYDLIRRDNPSAALIALETVCGLWAECEYSYKGLEVLRDTESICTHKFHFDKLQNLRNYFRNKHNAWLQGVER